MTKFCKNMITYPYREQPILYGSEFIHISGAAAGLSSKLRFQVYGSILNTRYLPHTYGTLQKILPTVLDTQCFNDDRLPFVDEVKNTEIGHLFEHILLEYLCLEMLKRGAKRTEFQGLTSWNWQKDTRGLFHIAIQGCVFSPPVVWRRAVRKAVVLTELVLSGKTVYRA